MPNHNSGEVRICHIQNGQVEVRQTQIHADNFCKGKSEQKQHIIYTVQVL